MYEIGNQQMQYDRCRLAQINNRRQEKILQQSCETNAHNVGITIIVLLRITLFLTGNFAKLTIINGKF